jgi:putative ABC transport system permease protein
MDALLQDLRYALRSHARSLGVFSLAVVSLALGVAANTTIFSAVDVFLIRPLPYPSPESLVRVWSTNAERGWTEASVSLADYLDWRGASRTLRLAAYQESSHSVAEGDRPEQLDGVRTTADLFAVIGIAPLRGRTIATDEEALGAGPVVAISERLWERRYARDPAAIGATLLVDGEPRTIVGVLPEHFQFPSARTDLFLPLGYDPAEVRTNRYLRVVGRLRDGASLEAARADLGAIARRLEAEHTAENRGMGTNVLRLADDMFDETFRTAAIICTTAVAFVLLIACANIANLLLARATARDREIAVRTVLGAGRLRIARQLLTESMVLALVGGALGLVLSHWGIGWLVAIMPESFPFVERIGIDRRVLAFTLGVSVAAGVLFGMAPAIQATRPRLAATLREAGARGATVGGRKARLRGFLVAAEIGLALVLLISAGLLVRGYLHMQRTDLGFEQANIFTGRINLLRSEYPDSAQVTAFQERLLERVSALPGVEAAGVSSSLPMQGATRTYYTIEGEAPVADDRRPVAIFRIISPGYLDVLGIPLAAGRAFGPDDRTGSPPVMLVNEAFVRRHFADGEAIGRGVVLSTGVREVVGVVGDTRDSGPDSEPEPVMYTPAAQAAQRTLTLALRTTGTPGSVAEPLRHELALLDPRLPLYRTSSMEEIVRAWNEGNIVMARLLGVFAGMALLLAVIGVYGVMAYNVTQRTREVGIRMALGAERRDIVRLIVRQGAALAVAGLVAGLLFALATARFLASFLFGISPFDPLTFAAVTAALAAAALVASWVPARRATRVDPVVALRDE